MRWMANRIGSVSFVAAFVSVVLSGAAPATAEVVCGGYVNGVKQAACGYKAATRKPNPVPTCPSGSFFDLTTWSCWTCPPETERTHLPVIGSEACIDVVKYSAAAYHRKWGLCGGGQFFDPRNGGECWSCPSGFNRTIFFAVDHEKACEKVPVFGPWSRATYHGKPGCDAGQFFDPREGGECWSCPVGYDRTILWPVTDSKACEKKRAHHAATKIVKIGCPEGQIFDLWEGGSCWTCEANPGNLAAYDRTVFPIHGSQACENTSIGWKTPPYREPGMFGLSGAAAVAIDIMTRQKQVLADAVAKYALSQAGGNRQVAAGIEQQQWDLIRNRPQSSPVLSMLLFLRLTDAALGSSDGSSAALRQAFEPYMTARRTYVAQDALNAYDAWKVADDYIKIERQSTGLHTLFSYGRVPPDFQTLTRDSMRDALLGVGATAAVGVATVVAVGSVAAEVTMFAVFTPFSYAAVHGISAGAAAGAGPFAILAAGAFIAAVAIDQVIQIETARPKLVDSLNAAKQPVNLATLLKQPGGREQALLFWSYAVGNESVPAPAAVLAAAATAQGNVTLYEAAGYAGRSLTLSSSATDLSQAPFAFNDITSSIKLAPGTTAAVWSAGAFTGRCQTITTDTADLTGSFVGNDVISSVQLNTVCPGGVHLFEAWKHDGRSLAVTGSVPDLSIAPHGFNDLTSSIYLAPGTTVAAVWSAGNYTGRCQTINAPVLDLGGSWVGNDQISSVQAGAACPSGVYLFEGINYDGRSLAVTGNITDLSVAPYVGFNDVTSSIKLQGATRAAVYSAASFRQTCQDITADTPNLVGSVVGNDTISSIQVGVACPPVYTVGVINSAITKQLTSVDPNTGRTTTLVELTTLGKLPVQLKPRQVSGPAGKTIVSFAETLPCPAGAPGTDCRQRFQFVVDSGSVAGSYTVRFDVLCPVGNLCSPDTWELVLNLQ